MIPIQINGKTVFKTFDEWINMTDQDYQDLVAKDDGLEIDNPFDTCIDKIRDSNFQWNLPDLPKDEDWEDSKKPDNGKDLPK